MLLQKKELWLVVWKKNILGNIFLLQEELKNNLKIYPDPASDKVYIEMLLKPDNTTMLEVFDINGRSILKQELQNSQISSIDVSKLNSGIYFIKVMTATTVYSKKFVVQHN